MFLSARKSDNNRQTMFIPAERIGASACVSFIRALSLFSPSLSRLPLWHALARACVTRLWLVPLRPLAERIFLSEPDELVLLTPA